MPFQQVQQLNYDAAGKQAMFEAVVAVSNVELLYHHASLS